MVAGISPNAPPSLEDFYGAVSENLGEDYNSPAPGSAKSISLAMAVMSLLGKNTYQPQFNAEDKKATVEVLSVMDIHGVNATKAVDIMSQVEQMANMTAEQAAIIIPKITNPSRHQNPYQHPCPLLPHHSC